MHTPEDPTRSTSDSFPAFDPADDTVSEPALAFLLRPTGNETHFDRSAGQVLEVAQVFGDAVVDIRHYRRGEVVRLGLADDFFVPVDLLPEDHHPVFCFEDGGWVAHLSRGWAGFVDKGEVRTDLGDRLVDRTPLRLEEGETLVIEVGQSLFVARLVWKSRKLPIPMGRDFDPVMVAVIGAMGVVAALLGVVGAYLPPPPQLSDNGDVQKAILIELYRQPPEPVVVPVKTAEKAPAKGGSEGPKTARRDPLHKQPGNPDADVVKNKMEDLFAGVDAALSETSLNEDLTRGIKGLIGSRGTQLPGLDGPGSGRCLSADCTGIGIAQGPGMGDIGAGRRPGGPEGETWGGTKPPRSEGPSLAVDGPITNIGNIDKAAVDRVVKQHLSQIKYCYSRELQRTPGLSGKVSVKFIIAGDGSVSSAVTDKTTLGSPSAEACINGRFLRMTFPALKGGGIAIIKYPFIFAEG